MAASGVFPLVTDFPYGTTIARSVAVRQFGSSNARRRLTADCMVVRDSENRQEQHPPDRGALRDTRLAGGHCRRACACRHAVTLVLFALALSVVLPATLAAAQPALHNPQSPVRGQEVRNPQPVPAQSGSAIRIPEFAIQEAITAPRFVGVAEADKAMAPDEPVIGFSLGAESRAYSVWQLERVLVVNDTLAGRALAITWCPFSHTAVVYSRQAGGRALTFEADGRVLNDAIVLRDRETGSAWTQQDGRAIEGPQAGARLQQLPALLTNWKAWKTEQTGGPARRGAPGRQDALVQVLDKRGAEIRSSLYADYDADRSALGLGHVVMAEPRMSGKTLIVGIVSGDDRLAVPLSKVQQNLVVNVVVDRQAMAILYDPASDTVRVVRSEARGHKVSLRRGPPTDIYGRPTPPYLLDEETASRWDLTGKSFQGEMVDQRLILVPYRCEYWYAWQAYFPKSRVE